VVTAIVEAQLSNLGAIVAGGETGVHPFPMTQSSVRPAKPAEHCPVLIVEDDADLREMMAQLLSLEGFRTETVANGRDALRYLEAGERPDVILLDLMMPVMDGWEFRRRQVQNPSMATVPVVVLSAADPARASELGGTAFLKKPLDFDRLLELVRRFCAPADC
jgi:CheY-like chemotaxis protein